MRRFWCDEKASEMDEDEIWRESRPEDYFMRLPMWRLIVDG